MNQHPKILIVKESRQDEKRVALIPEDVSKLIKNGFTVFVEDQAGMAAGYDDRSYQLAGAQICNVQNKSLEDYRSIFKNIDIIIRVKRPNRTREKLESLAFSSGTKMIGSLDPLEKNSDHIKEYHEAGIDYYSFDQFCFPPNTPMDALKKMSSFAGRLSIEDAIEISRRAVEKVVIIGYGDAGQAAYTECLKRKLSCAVITSHQSKANLIKSQGGTAIYVSRDSSLSSRQDKIKNFIKDADIVITAASSNGIVAPILIPNKTLLEMKPNTVIIDLSVPEGGNVEGSQPDAALILGNQVCVKNVSGYPKAIPAQASLEWSKASYYFINMLINTPQLLKRRQ